MLPPISHLEDCNLNHYNLQLSLYGWMLEQFGYEVVHLEIQHADLVKEDNNWKVVKETVYEFPYLKQEIENMLNYERAT